MDVVGRGLSITFGDMVFDLQNVLEIQTETLGLPEFGAFLGFASAMALTEFPMILLIRFLHIGSTPLEQLPNNIEKLERLEILSLTDNWHLKSLPDTIHNLQYLWHLRVDKRLKKSGFDFDRLIHEPRINNVLGQTFEKSQTWFCLEFVNI